MRPPLLVKKLSLGHFWVVYWSNIKVFKWVWNWNFVMILYMEKYWMWSSAFFYPTFIVGTDTLSTSASVVFMATLLADSLWIPEPNSFNPRIRGSEWPNQVDHYTIITVEYHLFHPSISLVQFIPFMMPKMWIKARTFCPKMKLL